MIFGRSMRKKCRFKADRRNPIHRYFIRKYKRGRFFRIDLPKIIELQARREYEEPESIRPSSAGIANTTRRKSARRVV